MAWSTADLQFTRTEGDVVYAFEELLRQAAQWELFHNDDTEVKILVAIGLKPPPTDPANGSRERTGTFTPIVVARSEEHEAALFFSGCRHAGENLSDVLHKRVADLDTPIQMSDALSRNTPKEFETIVSNCLTHARRNFVDMIEDFPDEVKSVLKTLKIVYAVDAEAKRGKLSPEKRPRLHRTKSQQAMDRLQRWCQRQFDERLVEPNSQLGEAITYMLKHWDKLTRFLQVPGAPLDNNIAERALERAIMHRKNSLFYRTANGAAVGDL